MKELLIRDLSHYEIFSELRFQSKKEIKSIQLILDNNHFISINHKRSLIYRMKYLKLKYQL